MKKNTQRSFLHSTRGDADPRLLFLAPFAVTAAWTIDTDKPIVVVPEEKGSWMSARGASANGDLVSQIPLLEEQGSSVLPARRLEWRSTPVSKNGIASQENSLRLCEGQQLPQSIGIPVPLFDVDKTFNPENVLKIFTHVDENCHISIAGDKAARIDMYWKMYTDDPRETCRKRPAEKTFRIMHKRLLANDVSVTAFTLELHDLNALHHEQLASTTATVKLEKVDGHCVGKAVLDLQDGKSLEVVRVTGVANYLKVTMAGIAALIDEDNMEPSDYIDALIIEGKDEQGNPITLNFKK